MQLESFSQGVAIALWFVGFFLTLIGSVGAVAAISWCSWFCIRWTTRFFSSPNVSQHSGRSVPVQGEGQPPSKRDWPRSVEKNR